MNPITLMGGFNQKFEGVLLILKPEIIIIVIFFKVNFMCWGEKFNNGFLEKFGERDIPHHFSHFYISFKH